MWWGCEQINKAVVASQKKNKPIKEIKKRSFSVFDYLALSVNLVPF